MLTKEVPIVHLFSIYDEEIQTTRIYKWEFKDRLYFQHRKCNKSNCECNICCCRRSCTMPTAIISLFITCYCLQCIIILCYRKYNLDKISLICCMCYKSAVNRDTYFQKLHSVLTGRRKSVYCNTIINYEHYWFWQLLDNILSND